MLYRATFNGVLIAESGDTVKVDGHRYFPPDGVRREYLVPSDTTSICPWKGQARYFTLRVDGRENRDAAWCYADPYAAAERIRGRIAFWHGVRVQRVPQAPGAPAASDGTSPRPSVLGRIAELFRR
ncbi:DUF427 domain-containing protein [Streptomyces sp. NPDC058877]|uniref:DUF427 domain-containing protein n=1 Tax=unclassified Streptomyces TaxID=2593676 RepID=UPI0036989B54